MTIWNEIALVFTEIGWIPAVCIILGLICIIIEIFQPGFGVFGITGTILLVVGIAVRAYHSGAGNPIIQIIVLIGISAVVILLSLGIMVLSMKKGLLSRTAFVQKSRAVDIEMSKGTEDYTSLIGKHGKTTSILRPGGNAQIEGKIYTVISSNAFIDKDKEIVVESVEGVKIIVKEHKMFEEE